MDHANESIVRRALASGTVAGMTSAIAAALVGRYETASYAAPLNATSHVLWGEKATQQDDASLKYTLTGFLLNHAAAVFWAMAYEKLFARRKGIVAPVLGAAAVTAGAYVTDYYLVPKRFTPGFEKRVSGRSMAMIYGALALGFVAATMVSARGRT
jgi:hypothetical protein